MKLEFGYGKTVQTAVLPEKNLLATLVANPMAHERTGSEAVQYALEHPIGTEKLRNLVRPGQKIVIISSDISRPMPTWEVMPHVLNELREAKVDMKDVKLVFGLGSHRPHTEEEKRHLAGDEAYETITCEDSTPEDCVHMGVTKAGTPVDISRAVAEADVRICLGNIEFHWFAGFSGGAKAIMPGVSTPAAIQQNHRMMVQENAATGILEGNPIREDIEEAERFCPVQFILNVVLDEHKHIVHAVAGDVTKAHREGCKYLDKMYRKEIPEKADIVIVSQGGAPKDANLYQAQKALDNAKHAVKKGGTIIWVAACSEGVGSATFEKWMLEAPTSHSLVERISKEFRLGGHKAAAIGLMLDSVEIVLISEMEEEKVKNMFLTPASSVQEALDAAFEKHGPDATVIAMPFGGATLPLCKK